MDPKKLIDRLNLVWKCIPSNNYPTYEEFNTLIRVGNNSKKLEKLEKHMPKLGVSRYGSDDFGISTISLIATITDMLAGFRLAAIVDEDGIIVGWSSQPGDNGEEKLNDENVKHMLKNLRKDDSGNQN